MAKKTAPRWNSSSAPLYTFMSCKGTALPLFVQRRTLIQYMLISEQKVIRRFCLCRIQKQQDRQCVYEETWRRVRKILVPTSAIPKIWYRITRRQRFGRSVPPASTKRKKFHVKWPTFFQIVIRFRFSWNIFTKVSDIKKTMQIRPVGDALMHADGRIDRRTTSRR